MNYTTNYHLPQWVETDRIQMEDFNQAMADIDLGIKNAQDGADTAYCPTNKPYVVGNYRGTGDVNSPTTITLGFRPSLVIVSNTTNNGTFGRSIISNGTQDTYALAFHDAGFTVYHHDNSPDLNEVKPYVYIAFR